MTFTFVPSADAARTHPDPDTILATIPTSGQRTQDPDPETARTLTGLAARTDLTKTQYKKVLARSATRGAWETLRVLLCNHRFAVHDDLVATALARLDPDGAYVLALHADLPRHYLPRILPRITASRNSFGNPETTIQRLRDQLGDSTVNQAFARAAADYYDQPEPDESLSRGLLQSPGLTEEALSHLCSGLRERVAASRDNAGNLPAYLDRDLTLLLHHPNLASQDRHLLYGVVCDNVAAYVDIYGEPATVEDPEERWADRFAAQSRLLIDREVDRFRFPEQRTAPASLIAAALVHPHMRVSLLAGHARVPIPDEAFGLALGMGAPVTILTTHRHPRLTPTVLDMTITALDDPSIDPTIRRDILERLLQANLAKVGTPVWDRLYTAWTADLDADQRAQAIATLGNIALSAIAYMDKSATPDGHRYAAWASHSHDPHLRATAVAFIHDTNQALLAAHDPAPQVRLAVLSTDQVTTDLLTMLVTDPDGDVRHAVAQHDLATEQILTALTDDPEARIRDIVAGRFVDALARA